ncbi:MAG: hypothetical protein ACRC6M_11080 [Microcystaceae cyanobacterium]
MIFFLSDLNPTVMAQTIPNNSVCDAIKMNSSSEKIPQPQAQKNLTKATNNQLIKSSEPELWWVKEQVEQFEKVLLISWQTDDINKRLDLIVDRQNWSRLDYLERYRFVHQFGTVARENHYSLRVFNQQQKCLVAYWCNFQITPSQCQMKFESPKESRFQIYTPAQGGFNFDQSF